MKERYGKSEIGKNTQAKKMPRKSNVERIIINPADQTNQVRLVHLLMTDDVLKNFDLFIVRTPDEDYGNLWQFILNVESDQLKEVSTRLNIQFNNNSIDADVS